MKRYVLFLCLTLQASAPLFARKSTDILVMRNGDRMTCEVKGLNKGVLYIGLDYADGTISVDWSKVARLESNQLFVVMVQDGSSYEGTLNTAETTARQPLKIRISQAQGGAAEIERSQIVKMTQTSEKFFQRFNGAINSGINYSKGNTATQYSFSSEVQYLRERWAAKATYGSNLSSNSGSTTSTRNQVGLEGYHLLPWNNYLYAGLGDFLQSTVQGITLQTSIGAGIGRFLKNTDHANILVLGGLAWQGTQYTHSITPAGTQNLAAALIAAQVNIFKFSKTTLTANAVAFPTLSDPGRARFQTNVVYYLKIYGDLSWNSSFYGNWDTQPPAGFAGSDYGASSGLSWTFGNR